MSFVEQHDTSIKKGNSYLKTSIVSAAWAAVRVKDSYWHALFERMRKHMKAQKAIVAVARRILKVVYKILETLTHYQEKGAPITLTYRPSSLLLKEQDNYGLQQMHNKERKRTNKVLE